MKFLKRLGIVFLFLVIVVLVLQVIPKQKYSKENPWLKSSNDGKPLVMAHGGGRGVYPDNTLSAFDYSYDLGVDVLEMDVQMTSDGILVLRHGENETGNIRHMSNCDTVIWEETYQYLYDNCNFGYNFELDGVYPYRDLSHTDWVDAKVHITTLESLFDSYGDTILYTIEIKADADAPREATADELVRLIELYDLNDYVLVATSYEDISLYVKDTYPDIQLSTSHNEAQTMIIHSYTLTSVFYNPTSYAALQLPRTNSAPVVGELSLDTKLLINTAHSLNMAVHYWTINDPDEMRRLIELGCDGIITDYPELLMEIIDEMD